MLLTIGLGNAKIAEEVAGFWRIAAVAAILAGCEGRGISLGMGKVRTTFLFLTQTETGCRIHVHVAHALSDTRNSNLVLLMPSRNVCLRLFGGGLLAVLFVSTAPGQIRSTGDGGSWSEASTWEGGVVPQATDDVVIASGATVVLPAVDAELGSVLVEESATLEGRIPYSIVVNGDVMNIGTITETFEVLIRGSFTNRGDIVHPGSFYVYGDITNSGSWEGGQLYLTGTGPRTVQAGTLPIAVSVGRSFKFFDQTVPRALLEGDNYFPSMQAPPRTGDMMVVAPGSRLIVDSIENGIWNSHTFLVNRGDVVYVNRPDVFGNPLFEIGGESALFELSEGSVVDSGRVTTRAGQAPLDFANAVQRRWQVEAWPDNGGASVRHFVLLFPAHELNFSDPDSLTLRRSTDGGKTWSEVATTSMDVRYSEDLFGAYYQAEGDGDFGLAGEYILAGGTPSARRQRVSIQLLGRDQIRLGGPAAEYRVHYANTGGTPVYRGLISLTTGGGVYIDSVVIEDEGVPTAFGKGAFSLNDDSTDAMFVTPDLQPGEHRAFSVFLKAVPVTSGGATTMQSTEATAAGTPGMAIAVGGAAVGVFKGYLTDVFSNSLEEVIADPCNNHTELQDKFKTAFDKTDDKWASEVPFLAAAENGASAVSDAGLLKAGLGYVNVLNDVKTVSEAMVRGSERYEENYGRTIFDRHDCEPPNDPAPFPETDYDEKPFEPVTSFDPNEKVGPAGRGVEGFLTSAGELTYQIYFENLAAATAPAYRIVIIDTLSDALDPMTVVPRRESHPGFSFTQSGSILTWEVEGIELPPNVTPPEGEGFVEFTVETATGLTTGTEIVNRAEITFDLNDPILTNTHRNVLDLEPPTTTMSPLAAEVAGREVLVAWDADDGVDGSGIETVALFASIDGGPFKPFGVTSADSMTVAVAPGHGYAFYALARDRAGNTETTPPPSVSTVVVTGVNDQSGLSDFVLHPAYPNPMNGTTTIPFELSARGDVEVSVFDVVGRRIQVKRLGTLLPGVYHETLTLVDVASGLYFYEMRVRNDDHVLFRGVKRMIVVR